MSREFHKHYKVQLRYGNLNVVGQNARQYIPKYYNRFGLFLRLDKPFSMKDNDIISYRKVY